MKKSTEPMHTGLEEQLSLAADSWTESWTSCGPNNSLAFSVVQMRPESISRCQRYVLADRVDSEIDYGLKQILEFFHVDRAGLLRSLPDRSAHQITHGVYGEDVPSVPVGVELPRIILGWNLSRSFRPLPARARCAGCALAKATSKVEVPNPPPAGPVGLSAQLGYRYVTFLVKDLSGLCRRLQDKNVPFLMPEHESRPGVRFAMVQDPDGNIIELVELDPNIKSDFK